MIFKGAKNMKIKRIIAAVMSLVLVGGAYPFNTANTTSISIAEAADSQNNVVVSDGIKYTISGNTATVTGFTTGFEKNAVIPAEVNDCPVTKISSRAFSNSDIKTLVLGENIDSIESDAFQNCPLLTEVTLNDKLRRIEGYAFQDCVSLTKVNGGSNIEYIGFMAFESCVNLSEFELGEKVRNIGDSAFARTNIKELVIPESVNTLYDCPVGISPASTDPMYNANAVVIIKNPECKLEINSVSKKSNWDKCLIVCDADSKAHAFAEEYNVNFCSPEQYENGDYDKFELTELDELECLRKYGMSFEKCEGGLAVHYITFQNGNTITIPDEVGGLPVVKCELNTPSAKPHVVTPMAVYSGIEKVVIGKNVKFIGDLSFNSYINLKTVEGGEGLERIGYGAFCSLQNLESFNFGSNLKTIDNIAFAGCVKLSSLEFPDSLESIGDSAFASCINVNSVKFGKGLNAIGSAAFSGCNSIKEVKINEGQKEIVSGVFSNSVSFITDEESSIENESMIIDEGKDTYMKYEPIVITAKNIAFDNITYEATNVKLVDKVLAENGDVIFTFEGNKGGYTAYIDFTYEDDGNEKKQFFKYTISEEEYQDGNTQNEGVKGDANCDGNVDMSDVVLIMQALANPDKYGVNGSNALHITLQGAENGDVDKNIKGLTVGDALKIQRYLLGKEESL